jgi:REP element-mobilizing transposase RayT
VRDLRPGDEPSAVRFEHDAPGEPWEDELPGLRRSALEQMRGPAVYLDLPRAEVLLAQFHETSTFRGWALRAVAVMVNHFHLVVSVADDPDPRRVLADFKAYGTRALSRRFGKPPSNTWWTAKGSVRKLPDEKALANAVRYVLLKQPYPLVVWPSERDPARPPGEPGA